MAETSLDIVVIGGGPGGYVAAIRAAQLGLKAAVVEREHLGGICLNWGCIPTKVLLRASEIHHLLHNLEPLGFSAKEVSFDIARVVAHSRKVAKQLNAGVGYLLKKNKVPVFEGHGRLGGRAGDGRRTVAVEADGKPAAELTARHVILATGARPRTLPGLEPDGKLVWTYKEAMVPKTMPKSVLVVGSGAIGIEFASFYRDMGAEVTVVEILERVLPFEDEEISALARQAFEKQGMKIHTGATVTALKKGRNRVTATLEGGDGRFEVTAARVILAVGITGNVDGPGRERPCGGEPVARERRARRLGHRRSRRPALARPQGDARRRRLRRADRGRVRDAPPGCFPDSELHLLPAPGGERGAHRGGGEGEGPRGPGRPLSLSCERQGPGPSPRGWSRPCSTSGPGSSWALT
jgi:dihydrolipoamide dehydrogenase